ncbi:hypothetical protein [Xenorhabdus bovienii]|nr:hypothetical protein [Xenorhabdus bovienii]
MSETQRGMAKQRQIVLMAIATGQSVILWPCLLWRGLGNGS